MAEESQTPVLSKAISGKYKLKHIVPGEIHFKGNNYDFTTMDLATADKLFKEECVYLEPIDEKKNSSAVSPK